MSCIHCDQPVRFKGLPCITCDTIGVNIKNINLDVLESIMKDYCTASRLDDIEKVLRRARYVVAGRQREGWAEYARLLACGEAAVGGEQA